MKGRCIYMNHYFFCAQILIDLSSEPEAIKFSVGWQATLMTGSVWPSSFWSNFLEFSSHMYTQLSSDPLTIRFPFVTENAEETEYWELAWPVYVLMYLAEEMFHNLCKIWEHCGEISALITNHEDLHLLLMQTKIKYQKMHLPNLDCLKLAKR